jgi:flagellar biosynthesis/type III secretory pathway protein FliH
MSLPQVVSIIPAPVMAQRKAEQAELQSAKHRAEQLIQSAQRDAEDVRQEAYQAGLAEGRRQALVRHIELAQQLALFRDAARDQMVDVFVQGLNHILVGPARRDFFHGFIDEAHHLLGRMRFARLLVHPGDETLLRSLVQQSSLGQSDSPVSIECDPDMPPGGCALVSDVGKVSVSMGTRLDDVRQVLEQVFSMVDITIGEDDAALIPAPAYWASADASVPRLAGIPSQTPTEPTDARSLDDI